MIENLNEAIVRLSSRQTLMVSPYSTFFLFACVNPIHASVPFPYTLEISGFLTFSGDIDMENWHEMV